MLAKKWKDRSTTDGTWAIINAVEAGAWFSGITENKSLICLGSGVQVGMGVNSGRESGGKGDPSCAFSTYCLDADRDSDPRATFCRWNHRWKWLGPWLRRKPPANQERVFQTLWLWDMNFCYVGATTHFGVGFLFKAVKVTFTTAITNLRSWLHHVLSNQTSETSLKTM